MLGIPAGKLQPNFQGVTGQGDFLPEGKIFRPQRTDSPGFQRSKSFETDLLVFQVVQEAAPLLVPFCTRNFTCDKECVGYILDPEGHPAIRDVQRRAPACVQVDFKGSGYLAGILHPQNTKFIELFARNIC